MCAVKDLLFCSFMALSFLVCLHEKVFMGDFGPLSIRIAMTFNWHGHLEFRA